MTNTRLDRTTHKNDGLHYHVYVPMEDPRNPRMILMYRAAKEPIGWRTTANRLARETQPPHLDALPMVRQCRALLCVQRH